MTKETLKTYTQIKREQKQLEGMLRELEAVMAAPSGQRLTCPGTPPPAGTLWRTR